MTPTAILARVLIIAALAAGVWAAWHHYEAVVADLASVKVERDNANKALEASIDSINALRVEADAAQAAVAANRARQAAIQKEADRYAQLLNDARRDPVALAWLDGDVPRAVWCSLRARPEGVDCARPGDPRGPARAPGDGDAKPRSAGLEGLRLDRLLSAPRERVAGL